MAIVLWAKCRRAPSAPAPSGEICSRPDRRSDLHLLGRWYCDGSLLPLMDDQDFEFAYREMSRGWLPRTDVRWRMWLLTSLAQQCQRLSGNFAEFGTWRGGCAYMILSRTKVAAEHRFFLFDTFAGIPADRLTGHERDQGFAGKLSDTSVEYVDDLLARWRPRYQLCPGDIFDTLGVIDVGELSFAHIDMNAMAPSKAGSSSHTHVCCRAGSSSSTTMGGRAVGISV